MLSPSVVRRDLVARRLPGLVGFWNPSHDPFPSVAGVLHVRLLPDTGSLKPAT